jgi:hypothetical protein
MFYAGFQRYFFLKGGYGRAETDDENAQRISGGFESGKETPFDFDYLYTNRISKENQGGRIQNARLGFDLGKNYLSLFAREDWFLNKNQNYDGIIESGVSLNNTLDGYSASFVYKERGTSAQDLHFSRERELYSLAFSAALSRDFSQNHSLSSAGSYIYEENRDRKFSAFLLSLDDKIVSSDFSKGINTSWDLSSETRNERRWEYIRVPAGTGTHIKDTIFGGFVEKEFGDYVAREVIVSGDNSLDFFVRNNFLISWYYSTKNGLRFSGTLANDCELADEKGDDWFIYLPFAANINKNLREKISYSMISYNQYLSIFPAKVPEIKSNIRLGASKNTDLQKNRRILEEESDFLYHWSRFHLGFSNKGFIEETSSASQSVTRNAELLIKDINLKPIQNFVVLDWLNVFLEETFGKTIKNDIEGTYSALRGGFRFLPQNAGTAEISYTYAYVDFAGELRFNMADGFALGNNHRIGAFMGIRAGEHLRFSGFVRGDKNKDTMEKWRFSMSINAEIAIR